MWAEPALRGHKSTMPRRRFGAVTTVEGAGAGPLNPGLRQIEGRLPEVVGGRIYGELHIGPQDEKMDTQDFSPTTHPVSCEVALGDLHGSVLRSTDSGKRAPANFLDHAPPLAAPPPRHGDLANFLDHAPPLAAPRRARRARYATGTHSPADVASLLAGPGRGEQVMFETGELGWWFGAPGDKGPDDLSFYRRQVVDEFPVTRVLFGDRFATKPGPAGDTLVTNILNGVRICYPISSDAFVSKKKPRLTLTFGLSDTAQLKVPDYSADTDYIATGHPADAEPNDYGDWADWVIQKRGRVLAGARLYAALIMNETPDGRTWFKTVLLSDIPLDHDHYPSNMPALVHLGTLKLGYTRGDTVIEAAIAPTLVGKQTDIPGFYAEDVVVDMLDGHKRVLDRTVREIRDGFAAAAAAAEPRTPEPFSLDPEFACYSAEYSDRRRGWNPAAPPSALRTPAASSTPMDADDADDDTEWTDDD